MDFKFSPEDEAFRQEFRSWLEHNIPRDWRDDELHDPDTLEEMDTVTPPAMLSTAVRIGRTRLIDNVILA